MSDDYIKPEERSTYIKALQTTKDILDKHHIHFWLDFGTLWGAIRENDILEFDDDIDISIWLEDAPKVAKLKKEFIKKGYNLKINPDHLNFKIWNIKRNKKLMCILFKGKSKGYIYRIRFYPVVKPILIFNKIKDGRLLSYVYKIILKLKLDKDADVSGTLKDLGKFKKYEFYGDMYQIPEFPEHYLEWMYGDWRKVWTRKVSYTEMGKRNMRLKEVLERRGKNCWGKK